MLSKVVSRGSSRVCASTSTRLSTLKRSANVGRTFATHDSNLPKNWAQKTYIHSSTSTQRYRKAFSEDVKKTSVVVSMADKVGGLSQLAGLVSKFGLNMSSIESRPSKSSEWDYDFHLEFTNAPDQAVNTFLGELKKQSLGSGHISLADAVPWFPHKMQDLDKFSDHALEFGEELDADHPGFKDPVYRERRKMIAQMAKQFKSGEQLARVEYTPEEKEVWRTVYRRLKALYPTHACKAHNYIFPLLEQNCGYSEDNIPQLQDVSNFLQDCTGFRLRPVTGLLSSRDFLNGLAFRVFHSTQYIRHHSKPLYTPEPDVCHELMGHVPLYADPDFADFSQEIGLASLGASEEDIQKLATCYWFTVEFGLCKEGDEVRAFGAGLLSSFGELQYCLGDEPKKLPFDPNVAAVTKYPITSYQPLYFVTESFEHAKKQMREYADTLSRPFDVRYDPLTQTVEVFDSVSSIMPFAKRLSSEMGLLTDALEKLANK